MHSKRSSDHYRSLPHKWPYIEAAFLALVSYLAMLAIITLGIIMIGTKSEKVTHGFIAAVAVLVISWLLGYFRRMAIKCPLCKGTPLLDSSASRHTKAFRVPPFNYGTTAQFSVLLSHRFRCMYCGTGFDLTRKSSNVRERSNHR